jgi:hypothetical protein
MREYTGLGAVLVLLALAVWSTQAAAADPLEVTLVKLTSPVSSGSMVTFTIKTVTGAECKGQVRYRKHTQTLASKTTNDEGTATWSWRIGADARGNYPIDMQCTQGDKKGSLSAQLAVN